MTVHPLSAFTNLVQKKIVIFVLSAQNYCFLLAHENEFLVETGQVETSNSFELDKEIQSIKYYDTSL
jgi:hypothetical protein